MENNMETTNIPSPFVGFRFMFSGSGFRIPAVFDITVAILEFSCWALREA